MRKKNDLSWTGLKSKADEVSNTTISAEAPSNIAIVKYWGKHGMQLPNNPSVSMTLRHAVTKTHLSLDASQEHGIRFRFEGKEQPSFLPKLEQFIDRAAEYLPLLKSFHLDISSENTFPHSSGIASSASSMSALSMAILGALSNLKPETEEFKRQHSFLSRLGSGSACRSAFGGWAAWGTTSDTFAVALPEVHAEFQSMKDAILIVSAGEKSVSSTAGHQLMNTHVYAETRYAQARKRTDELVQIIKNGDIEAFVDLCEKEALELHALMMMSDPYFILIKPNTLKIIDTIREFRRETGIPLAFTCDAGPNVHLMYREQDAQKVENFIEDELKGYCENRRVIWDACGDGPVLKFGE
ncbi:MAG TPA: diphosphomevalonate decarboxylase [Saprospiraceae bacterium]|nr:diphosphomevalonate decarboxylase [Saprospiraceae bacterium]